MAKTCYRSQSVASLIQRKIATILQKHEIKNQDINMTTVSGVKVSRDLAYAKIYVTFLNINDENTIKNNIKVLRESSSNIRALLSKAICLRIIPKLIFFYDNSLIEGIRISKLMFNAIKRDKELL